MLKRLNTIAGCIVFTTTIAIFSSCTFHAIVPNEGPIDYIIRLSVDLILFWHRLYIFSPIYNVRHRKLYIYIYIIKKNLFFIIWLEDRFEGLLCASLFLMYDFSLIIMFSLWIIELIPKIQWYLSCNTPIIILILINPYVDIICGYIQVM